MPILPLTVGGYMSDRLLIPPPFIHREDGHRCGDKRRCVEEQESITLLTASDDNDSVVSGCVSAVM